MAGPSPVQAVLFVCNYNAVRSVMAAAITRHYFGQSLYVQSAGVRRGETDSFTRAVLDEIGIPVPSHQPRSLDELHEWEGLNFDLIIPMTGEAHDAVAALTRLVAAEVEFWPTPEPASGDGARDHHLQAYRGLRDALIRKIRARFSR